MKKTLTYILEAIVDKPEAIEIQEQEESGIINYNITVDAADMGKVIGKGGKVIRAIRNVMKIPAIKENKRIHVSLNESQ